VDLEKSCGHELARWFGALTMAFQASFEPILGHYVALSTTWGWVHRPRNHFSSRNTGYDVSSACAQINGENGHYHYRQEQRTLASQIQYD